MFHFIKNRLTLLCNYQFWPLIWNTPKEYGEKID